MSDVADSLHALADAIAAGEYGETVAAAIVLEARPLLQRDLIAHHVLCMDGEPPVHSRVPA